MAAHHGNEGSVAISSNTIAEVQNWTYDENDVDITTYYSMGDSAVTKLASGIVDGRGTVNCLLDETDTNGQEAMTVGSSVTLNLYPEGSATGDNYWTGTVIIGAMSSAGGRTGMVMRNFTFEGKLTWGTVS